MRKRLRTNYKRNRNAPVDKKFYTKDDIFISRIASILEVPKGKVRGMFSERTISAIRLNPLAEDPKKIEEHLKKLGLDLKSVDWADGTFIVLNRDKSELGKTEEYRKGLFYIQNLSSMLPVVIMNPMPGESVLDLCAAPGSKTTMIASYMRNEGKIVANDENFSRIKSLRDVLYQFYVKNTDVHVGDGVKFGDDNENKFDKVLLDAPCSGEGLVYLRTQKPLRFWNIKKVKAMSNQQKKLITSAFNAVKPGGILIYATCTLEPPENEEVVTHLLKHEPKAHIEEIDLINDADFSDYRSFIMNGITKWSGNSYDPEVKKCIRVIPGKTMQGFFVAKIRKS